MKAKNLWIFALLALTGCTIQSTYGTPYNLANVTNSTDILQISQNVNLQSEGWFGFMVLVGVFSITFISLFKADVSKAFTTAALLTSILATFLSVIGFITDTQMWITILFASTGLVIISIKSRIG